MNNKKDKDLEGFLKELSRLEDKYKIYISADYEEDLDEGKDGQWYTVGVTASVVYLDEEGCKI